MSMEWDSARAALNEWFDEHGREFGWRRPERTPWGVLVSEVMAQQTPLSRVEPAWEAWMNRWPAPGDLAQAAGEDVLRAWGNLGYPRRALRLRQAARAITDDPVLAGLMCLPAREAVDVAPDDLVERLRALPGVGPYTADAVATFACAQRRLPADTNVRRVLARFSDGVDQPVGAVTKAERARMDETIPGQTRSAVAWAVGVMELGALVCRAREPDCDRCPLLAWCAWVKAGRPTRSEPLSRQRWVGTDRQARGRILKALREGDGTLAREAALRAGVTSSGDETQPMRALASLADDGLVRIEGEWVALPR